MPKQCNDDKEVVDEIPADGFGDNFQVINNHISLNTASTSGVSSKVAKEIEFRYDLLQNKFSVRETMQWLTKVDESQVVIQMKQKCAMGVGITTSQIKTIRDNVLHAGTLYPEVNFESSDNNSVTALPEQMYFEKDSQLVVWNKDKEQFYKLADKIIMKKIDECNIRHFEDKSQQMLNVTHKDIIPGVRDSSDNDVWGVTKPSVAKFAAVTGKSNQLVKCVTHRNITKECVTYTSDDNVSDDVSSDAKFAAVTGRSNQLVKCVTHRNIIKEHVTVPVTTMYQV